PTDASHECLRCRCPCRPNSPIPNPQSLPSVAPALPLVQNTSAMSLAEARSSTPAAAEMLAIGRAARAATRRLANATTAEKDAALRGMAHALPANAAAILAENALD